MLQQQKDQTSKTSSAKAFFADGKQKDKTLTFQQIHVAYNHPGTQRTKELVKVLEGNGMTIIGNPTIQCMACDLAKAKPIPSKQQEKSKRQDLLPGQSWAHDLSGKMRVTAIDEHNGSYRSLAIDEHSGMENLQILRTKGQAKQHIRQLRNSVNNRFGEFGFKHLRTDNAKEYLSKELEADSMKYGYHHTFTPPYYHQGNPNAENALGINETGAVTLILHAKAPLQFWGLASKAFSFVKQFTVPAQPRLQSGPNLTPYELYYDKPLPDLEFIKPWGSDVIIYEPKELRQKMEPRGT
jgi:hypothetical protein